MAIRSLDQELNDQTRLYRGSPQLLQQQQQHERQQLQRGVAEITVEALAARKVLEQKKNAAAQMNLQLEQDPRSVAQKDEEELMQLTKNEVAQQTGGVLEQKQRQDQQNLQKLMAQMNKSGGGMGGVGAPPNPRMGGIATNPVPNMSKFSGGGIVAFEEGGGVEGDPSEEEIRVEMDRIAGYARKTWATFPSAKMSPTELRNMAIRNIKDRASGLAAAAGSQQQLSPQLSGGPLGQQGGPRTGNGAGISPAQTHAQLWNRALKNSRAGALFTPTGGTLEEIAGSIFDYKDPTIRVPVPGRGLNWRGQSKTAIRPMPGAETQEDILKRIFGFDRTWLSTWPMKGMGTDRERFIQYAVDSGKLDQYLKNNAVPGSFGTGISAGPGDTLRPEDTLRLGDTLRPGGYVPRDTLAIPGAGSGDALGDGAELSDDNEGIIRILKDQEQRGKGNKEYIDRFNLVNKFLGRGEAKREHEAMVAERRDLMERLSKGSKRRELGAFARAAGQYGAANPFGGIGGIMSAGGIGMENERLRQGKEEGTMLTALQNLQKAGITSDRKFGEKALGEASSLESNIFNSANESRRALADFITNRTRATVDIQQINTQAATALLQMQNLLRIAEINDETKQKILSAQNEMNRLIQTARTRDDAFKIYNMAIDQERRVMEIEADSMSDLAGLVRLLGAKLDIMDDKKVAAYTRAKKLLNEETRRKYPDVFDFLDMAKQFVAQELKKLGTVKLPGNNSVGNQFSSNAPDETATTLISE